MCKGGKLNEANLQQRTLVDLSLKMTGCWMNLLHAIRMEWLEVCARNTCPRRLADFNTTTDSSFQHGKFHMTGIVLARGCWDGSMVQVGRRYGGR